jgi:hypothetical protein
LKVIQKSIEPPSRKKRQEIRMGEPICSPAENEGREHTPMLPYTGAFGNGATDTSCHYAQNAFFFVSFILCAFALGFFSYPLWALDNIAVQSFCSGTQRKITLFRKI